MARPFRIPDRGYTPPKAPPKRNPTLARNPERGRAPDLKPGTRGPAPKGDGTGTANAIDGAQSLLGGWMETLKSGLSMAGPYGATIVSALSLGEAARRTPEGERQNAPTSGRGAGRAGFRDSNNNNRYNDANNQGGSGRPKASGTKITINGKTYDTGYHSKEIAELRRQNPGGGNAAQSQSLDPNKPAYIPPSGGGGGNGRGASAPDGNDAKGTNTGFKGADVGMANTLLESLGINTVRYGQFESNDYAGSQDPTKKENKTDTDAKLTGQSVSAYVESGASPTNEEELPTPDTNIVNTGAVEGGAASGSVELSADSTNKGPALGSRRRAAQEFLADRPNMPAQYNESLVGLRASDASKGLLYASGKYWQEDGNGGFTEISKADYKTIKRGDQHAQQFAADKIENVKSTITKGDNADNDTDGFSVVDATSGGMTQEQAEAIGSGGFVETVIEPSEADQPEVSALSPSETSNDDTQKRIDWLNYKKEAGDFKSFIKEDDWAK